MNYDDLLQVAVEEALQGLAEGGIPIGAAMFDKDGRLLSRGHNRRVQENDPSIHEVVADFWQVQKRGIRLQVREG